MITRRTFLIGATSALTISAVNKFQWFLDNHGSPLLEVPEEPVEILYVDLADKFHLELGGITENGPCITWREFFEQRDEKPTKLSDFRSIYDKYGVTPSQLDNWCEDEDSDTPWYRNESPTASAYHELLKLNVGTEFTDASGEFIGGLEFVKCSSLVSNYIGVHAENEMSLSLLQHKLNEMNTGIALQIIN